MTRQDLELTIVMPVYNEEEGIDATVEQWAGEMERLGIRYEFLVYNDGSKDATGDRLGELARRYDKLVVCNKSNEGHGPTILQGYREATAPWTFQTDSDGEMSARHFLALWEKRDEHDALFGVRVGRQQNLGRRVISAISRLTVAALFGSGVRDVNTPYRLIRSDLLKEIVSQIPDDTFAPNVIVSGTLARAGVRICNLPVPHEGRKTGTVSIVKWNLWKAAFKSFFQTLRCRPALAARAT